MTNLFCSPALLGVLTRWLVRARRRELPSLADASISAGAPVSRVLVDTLAAPPVAPAAQILVPYGATEALPVSLITGNELPVCGAAASVARSPASRSRSIAISDEDRRARGAAAPRRCEVGEIVVQRGRGHTRPTSTGPASTALAKIVTPATVTWHRMGDVGRIDAGRPPVVLRPQVASGSCFADRTLYPVPTEALFENVGRRAARRARRESSATA